MSGENVTGKGDGGMGELKIRLRQWQALFAVGWPVILRRRPASNQERHQAPTFPPGSPPADVGCNLRPAGIVARAMLTSRRLQRAFWRGWKCSTIFLNCQSRPDNYNRHGWLDVKKSIICVSFIERTSYLPILLWKDELFICANLKGRVIYLSLIERTSYLSMLNWKDELSLSLIERTTYLSTLSWKDGLSIYP